MRRIVALWLTMLFTLTLFLTGAAAEAQTGAAVQEIVIQNDEAIQAETIATATEAATATDAVAGTGTAKPTGLSKNLQWLIFALVVVIIVIVSAMVKKKFNAVEIAIIGLMAAIAYVAYAYLKIPLTVSGSTSSIHFGNMVPALTALLLDGVSGGLAGAVGLSIADIVSGTPHYAITTFILKFMIGFISGTVAHRVFKLKYRSFDVRKLDGKQAARNYAALIVSAASGLVFNIFADPFLGYFRKIYIQGLSEELSKSLAKISSAATSINAALCLVLCVALYLAIAPALKKSGILRKRR